MDVERWKRLSPLLDVLLELEPDARAEQLEILRADDPETAQEVEKLLALEEEGDGFIDQPLIDKPGQLKPGMRLGPYQLESLLGEGGMGLVWLATRADGLYKRRVALKLLRPGLAGQPCHIDTQVLRSGRTLSTVRATLVQDGGEPPMTTRFTLRWGHDPSA